VLYGTVQEPFVPHSLAGRLITILEIQRMFQGRVALSRSIKVG